MKDIIKILYKSYSDMKIGVIGLGFVGGAMYKSFEDKGLVEGSDLFGYDKYKNGGIGTIENIYSTDVVFLALPTIYNSKLCSYDKTPIYETCKILEGEGYRGGIVIKSTVEPETTNMLEDKYNLNFIHNPEFLTARTAYEDFKNQTHIVLGKGSKCEKEPFEDVVQFYKRLYPNAEISRCTSLESESMKIYVNCFYANKVQFFTEIFLTCQKNGSDYKKIVDMMLKNGWINPMHTTVPGPDGNISYGGLCFPKDTNALRKYMDRLEIPNSVLSAVIEERNSMRNDHDNVKL